MDSRKALVRDAYDAVALAWGEKRREGPTSERERKWVARFMDFLPIGARVLDLGCGVGVPILTELVTRGCRAVGVDFSRKLSPALHRTSGRFDLLRRPDRGTVTGPPSGLRLQGRGPPPAANQRSAPIDRTPDRSGRSSVTRSRRAVAQRGPSVTLNRLRELARGDEEVQAGLAGLVFGLGRGCVGVAGLAGGVQHLDIRAGTRAISHRRQVVGAVSEPWRRRATRPAPGRRGAPPRTRGARRTGPAAARPPGWRASLPAARFARRRRRCAARHRRWAGTTSARLATPYAAARWSADPERTAGRSPTGTARSRPTCRAAAAARPPPAAAAPSRPTAPAQPTAPPSSVGMAPRSTSSTESTGAAAPSNTPSASRARASAT